MMNSFKRANNHLTHAQIINEYEDKVRALERDNERLNAYNKKVENAKYTLRIKISSLRKALKQKPDKIKQAQLELLLNIREELK
ncbi:hypothetical protein [Jeotgalibaca porci]|uniref:hypothetical protein n=1 Tax=Jeotgalibaca porci TaxID=1868793 RepID=UPI00359F86BC